MTADNPLLVLSPLKNHAPQFDLIREDHYIPAVKIAIAEARSNIDEIIESPEIPDFKNTIIALETASETLGNASSIFYNQLTCNGTDNMQAIAEEIGPIQANFSSDIVLNEKLFEKIKHVYDRIDEMTSTPEERTLLTDTYKNFARGGALLDADKKALLRKNNEEMSTLGPVFSNNVKKSSEKFELLIDNETDMAGLPEMAIEGAKMAAEERGYAGKWVFTLDFPSYFPFLTYAESSELRQKLWTAYSHQAYGDEYDNTETILKIVRLRYERAQLLGYKDHADYVLERRMAEKTDRVMKFLKNLKDRYKPAAEKDLNELRAFAKSKGCDDLKPWDISYYSEKLQEEKFKFSSEDLRPYFPLDNVLKGTFEHFRKLFGLKFTHNSAYPVWHADVTAYDVEDERTGRFIGTMYADFFPRKGKKPGAWMTAYREQGLYRGKVERPVTAFVCNFTQPTKDKPSLLTFDEVLTIYHEMGHVTHGLLSEATYGSMASPNVLWDFVELPSQLQENWLYETEVLNSFAAHYETGEKIPADLIEKLRASKNFMAGWSGLRQTGLATLDMAWHTTNPTEITDLLKFEDATMADLRLFPRLGGPTSTAYSHIFSGGYSAGYYSYKWAEALDADAFELFLEKGLYDTQTAETYKREILSQGNIEHPLILYSRFRGRDADPDALLRREGLI